MISFIASNKINVMKAFRLWMLKRKWMVVCDADVADEDDGGSGDDSWVVAVALVISWNVFWKPLNSLANE